jgi:predicted ribosome quality control (RQC) complex YloA/Tae2 family protein
LQKKRNLQLQELSESEQGAIWKTYADAITGQMYAIKSGAEQARLWNYEAEEPTEIDVPLQKNLTPAQNAQLYYKRYRKAKTAAQMLTVQLQKAQEELAYLQTVADSLSRAEGESDLSQIRAELQKTGYLNAKKTQKPTPKMPAAKPMKFRTDGGFFVLCGKNNEQNDYITTKLAQKNDYWFHAKQIPGSHVLLQTADRTPSNDDLTQAAIIAATYSSASGEVKIEVDYTPARHVKKPSGAKPGYVIYHQNQSAYVGADRALCERLRLE